MKTGIELIARERKEQIEKHGRTIERDVQENHYLQLVQGARVLSSELANDYVDDFVQAKPMGWSADIWKKMLAKPYKERLIIAGALIAAEIDRLNHSEE